MKTKEKEAEQMMEQASKDIVATLVAEGKEHVEEEFEEKVEQAKEEAEKRQAQQEVKDMMQKRKRHIGYPMCRLSSARRDSNTRPLRPELGVQHHIQNISYNTRALFGGTIFIL